MVSLSEVRSPQPKAEVLFCPASTFKLMICSTQTHACFFCFVLFCLFFCAGSVVCVIQLRAGGGSCGQLLQLPELWRVWLLSVSTVASSWLLVAAAQPQGPVTVN